MTIPPTSNGREAQAETRFLCAALEWTFALGIHAPQDLLRRFPPRLLLRALSHRPDVRADIVQAARISVRPGESAAALGDRVMCAIECGKAKEADVVDVLPLDDCAQLLPHLTPAGDIWSFLLDARPEETDGPGRELYEIHRAFVRFLLERGLADGLLHPADLVNEEILNALVPYLSEEELRASLKWTLRGARAEHLQDHFPATLIGTHAPIPTLWSRVLRPCLTGALRRSTPPPPAMTIEMPSLLDEVSDDVTVTPLSRPPLPLVAGTQVPALEDPDRDATIAALASVGRLPPQHETLPSSVLRGIELLHWGLSGAESIDERLEVFQSTFRDAEELREVVVALLPVFFPDREAPSLLSDTTALVAEVEKADRRVMERQAASPTNAIMPPPYEDPASEDPAATPLPSAPRLSTSFEVVLRRKRNAPKR